jgi:hypothetical protein
MHAFKAFLISTYASRLDLVLLTLIANTSLLSTSIAAHTKICLPFLFSFVSSNAISLLALRRGYKLAQPLDPFPYRFMAYVDIP